MFPGLAVAEALRQEDGGAKVLFLATQRQIDRQILQKSGFAYEAQPIVPLPDLRKPWQGWGFYRCWRASIKRCEKLMCQNRPAAVLGLGGFASGPAMKVAAKMGIPAAMLNPDAIPGKANKFCRKYADRIFLQWQVSKEYFGKDSDKCVVTGCPVRKEIVERGAKSEARQKEAKVQLGLDGEKRLLVVMGGSQGGRNVNEAVVRCLTTGLKRVGQSSTLQNWQVLALVGKDYDMWTRQYAKALIPAKTLEFSDRMELVLGAADLVVSRAGASSLAELTAAAVPSILLPYPYHRDHHQLHNAQVLARAGAAQIIFDECSAEKTSESLTKVLVDGMNNDKLLLMAEAARTLGRPQAAELVARGLISISNR